MKSDHGAAVARGTQRRSAEAPHADNMRRLRAERRAGGLCPEDGDPVAPGKKQCQFHIDQDRQRKRRAALRARQRL